ncbi:Bumetanide-sensitive sodium-(potassium)-chloride cotransporter [Orchesella cincta]|uniref:Bumetanide-sensitive sodium-(Potassium)-chloride cotransporter n=1 Tax=Orchesella cincta TaxID=48709 RepID=A0A1D2MZE4_ORCCI|nr:Bumetanide-sensitive sodium-(potassium)-chloride cotransporter [Orchesella cincta]
MDLESLTHLRDKRNRFQVNRVDSVATGHHSPGSPSGGPSGPLVSGATLLGYKEYNGNGSVSPTPANGSRGDGNLQMNMTETSESLFLNPMAHLSNSNQSCGYPQYEGTESIRDRIVHESDSGDESFSDAENAGRGGGDSMYGYNNGHASPSPYNPSEGNAEEPSKVESHNTHNNTHTVTGSYDTKYAKSFRHFTREALPRLDNYRNMMSIQAAYRPTLDELHNITVHRKPSGHATGGDSPAEGGMVKFGWLKGVFVRCLLNIWGVMLFLRLSWVTGQAGIGQAWVVIMLATAVTFISGLSMSAISTNGQIKGAQALLIIIATSVVTFITSLSMAAISTNGVVKGGGTYYMISRSLGPEFGASIGLIFAIANAVAVAMYTVGFAESLVDLLNSLDTKIVEDPGNSVRIIGSIAIVVLTCVVVVGMEWEATAQVGLLAILVAAMIDFVIGSFIGPLSDEEYAKGFVGFNASVFAENFEPDYRTTKEGEQNFFSVFSIFFPAATGILAGANISGDLEDPQAAIPKGTLLAIIVTTASYLLFAIIVGSCAVRDATGNFTVPDWAVNNSREYINTVFRDCNVTDPDNTCEWGLMNSFQVMELVSAWGPLIYAGCFAATLSSALASLVSAPKVFQALCNDKLYPGLEFFGKGYGKNNEPVRGYVLTFFVALAFILIAELNYIAPLISNFFLAAYALVNFSTFHASLIKPVGWRPTFKYYNMWLSLVGFVLCVAVMFLISWGTALLTFAAILCLYLLVLYNKPDVNWGSSTQAQRYNAALKSIHELNSIEEHVKNYRPQILCLSGLPSARPPLVDFAHLITKNLSLLVSGHIVKSNLNRRQRLALSQVAQSWFRSNRVKGFFCVVDEMDFEQGARSLLQSYGVGKVSPNILLMGYKQNWQNCDRDELTHYFNTIHKSLDLHISVTVLRVEHGLDFSKKVTFDDDENDANSVVESNKNKLGSSDDSLPRNQSLSQMSQASSGDITPAGDLKPATKNEEVKEKKGKKDLSALYKNIDGSSVTRDVLDRITQFQRKYKHGTIDVWWLYDDGGLTLLLPYIINTRANWSTCKLRVFALANKKDELDDEQRRMAEMLAKFRIDYSDLIMIPDYNKKPQETTQRFFENMIAPFRSEGTDQKAGTYITETELLTLKDKNNRHMRLRELLMENSRRSDLVVMTLPMPKKGIVSAPLYMAWLELLTFDMPPFLLVRGNQQSVLTFYS